MIFFFFAILVYLEEDNIARAYFRVQPLMTQDGPLGPMTADFPDEGFLRIVPDKNEQHTFKERMRTLCGLCVMDLRFQPAEANKIRTNKNYSPTRGETNQYIVYSDAVRALPDDLLYQVVAESDVSSASTPFVYIRNGANIQGPFRRDNAQPAGEITQLPPDSCEIHAVTVSGQELLFFWPRAEAPAPRAEAALPLEGPAAPVETPAPAAEFRPIRPAKPAEPAVAPEPPQAAETAEGAAPGPKMNAFDQIQSLNVSVSEKANLLYQPSAAPTPPPSEQPARSLTGTKLYQAPQRAMPRRAHNPLMEAVESQRYAARMDGRLESRYEAPGATLPQNTELRDVNNPVDALKRLLQSMSLSPETQRQAVDVVLAQSGMRAMLSRGLAQQTNDLTLAAIQSQLQELEAERLMTLMQLDDVKKNLAAAHEEALGKLNMAEQKKLDQLHIAQQNAQNSLNELNKAIEPLENKRQELTEKIQEMQGALESKPHFLCPPAGGDASKDELIARVDQCLKAAGFQAEPGDAQAMLTALALTDQDAFLEIRSATCDDAAQGFQAFAAALGTSVVEFKKYWQAVIVPGGNAPLFVQSGSVRHPLIINTAIEVLGQSAEYGNDVWMAPYAFIPLYPNAQALPQALPVFPAVSLACVRQKMLSDSPLADETKAVILSLRKALTDLDHPLPLRAVAQISRFIAATQKELKGGVGEAIDRAACLYVAPHLLDFGVDLEPIKPLLAAMPRTMKALKL